MKKIIVGAIAAAALMTSAFAGDFSVSGYVRGGYKANLSDTVDTNSDGKADKPGHTAERWLEGLYFGNKTRARLNFNWKADENKAGALVRFQLDGDPTKWGSNTSSILTDTIKYADAYVNVFDNMFSIGGGKMTDRYLKTGGFEDWSVYDGTSGAVLALKPIQDAGLTFTAGANVNRESYADSNDFFFGVKYANDAFMATASYTLDGWGVLGLKINAVKDLKISAEAKFNTKDSGENKGPNEKLVLDEWIEYKGIKNLTLGLLSHQYINNTKSSAIEKDDNLAVDITPAALYWFTENVGASFESTIYLYNNLKDKDSYVSFTPAVHFKPTSIKNTEGVIWGQFSTDRDMCPPSIGVGAIYTF